LKSFYIKADKPGKVTGILIFDLKPNITSNLKASGNVTKECLKVRLKGKKADQKQNIHRLNWTGHTEV
jgi:hypothetical protein